MIFKKNGSSIKKTRSRFRNKKLIGVVCLVAAILIAFVLLPRLYEKQSETTTALQTVSPIAKGELITEKHVSLSTVGSYGLPKRYLENKDLAVGKIAKVDMLVGDIVTDNKIGDFVADPVMEAFENEGKRLLTVTLDSAAAGLASHLEKGDIVNVASIVENEDYMSIINTYEELRNLEIYDIENSAAESIRDAKKGSAISPNADIIVKTVTFIVNDEQASKLLEAEYTGALHLIFVSRGGI
ncbi:MAG: RcpC/CpaB family pilus assembly protein [Eubacteriales bacterium]|nr:RcpC/CpaB family pilus assembly protein [Eubacteriales bacterium]